MTTLTFQKELHRGSELNGQSTLPAMRWSGRSAMPTDLPEEDGLFVNYGDLQEMLPYQSQDLYGRELVDLSIYTATLENDYIKAVFLPQYGGRLWRLFDKTTGKNLLNHNPVIRPCNLALRNAWLCGGVEWNIGMTGHSPLTCSPLFVSRLTMEDGTPVLRMYEWERRRQVVYQMDFFLPENSRYLYARMRIENPNDAPVPMYWWSNVAVDETPDSRLIVPAESAYCMEGGVIDAIGGKSTGIVRRKVPHLDGKDISYPVNNRNSTDYFFHLTSPRRYMTMVQKDGYGLVQSSTARLKGRKLFIWGQGRGGKRWQEFLTEGGKPYTEIQAGLASTQMECLPMPAKTVWEWLETYGPIQLDPVKAHGSWEEAQEAANAYLDQHLPQQELEELLAATRETMAKRQADELLMHASGWGALEKMRREAQNERPLCPHLDFGQVGKEQEMWATLLQEGCFPEMDPMAEIPSYMIQSQWMKLVKKGAAEHFAGQLMLGLAEYAKGDLERAEQHFAKSLALAYSPWALTSLAQAWRAQGKLQLGTDLMAAAARLRPYDLSLVKEALFFLAEARQYAQMRDLILALPEETAQKGAVQLRLSQAYFGCGQLELAEETLCRDGGIVVADLQEGENSISDLWYGIQKEKCERSGAEYREKELIPPSFADFRMKIEE